MRLRITFATMVTAVALMATAAPGAAKGPSEGSLTGPGIDRPISLLGEGTSPGAELVEQLGIFYALFRSTPDPMLATSPTDTLGPRLIASWVLPMEERRDVIRQAVYPYAEGGPLVYTRPGQPFYGTERTPGGWFRAPASLVPALQSLGVPERAALVAAATPSVVTETGTTTARDNEGDGSPASRWLVVPVIAALAVAAVAGWRVRSRRRVAATA